jgi:hypothetical protein
MESVMLGLDQGWFCLVSLKKKGRKSGGCVLLLLCFYEKLVQRVGLCFGLSSFSLWISALFIEVEREVWSIYLP